jgi:hypothetical protein
MWSECHKLIFLLYCPSLSISMLFHLAHDWDWFDVPCPKAWWSSQVTQQLAFSMSILPNSNSPIHTSLLCYSSTPTCTGLETCPLVLGHAGMMIVKTLLFFHLPYHCAYSKNMFVYWWHRKAHMTSCSWIPYSHCIWLDGLHFLICLLLVQRSSQNFALAN